MKLERPCIGPDGEPRWKPNGERQRYARQLAREVDFGRLFAAAGHVLFHRMMKRGEIGPDDCISPTEKEVLNVIAWSDLRQLRLLRKIAEGYIVEREYVQ